MSQRAGTPSHRSPRRGPRRGRTSSAAAGAATRADLLSAARRLFGRRGFDGASVRAITLEAGANLGSVTYHFGSKSALYAAVLEQGLRPLSERVRAAASSDGTGLERMLRIVEAYFAHFEDHPDLPHLLLQEVAAGKKPPAVVLEIVRGVRDAIAGLHVEGVADGSVRPGDPVLTALSVVSQPIYLTLMAPLIKTVGPMDLADRATRRKAVAHVLDFVRSGLEPR